MKFVWIGFLCTIYLCVSVTYHAEASTLESAKGEENVDTELPEGFQPLNEEQPELLRTGPSDDARPGPHWRRCKVWTLKEYKKKLRKLGLKIPYLKLKGVSGYQLRRRRKKVVKTKRCPKRKGKRTLYSLCTPCTVKTKMEIHPAINALALFDEVDCKNQQCIKVGESALGKCVPFIYDVSLPVPNRDCSGITFKTVSLKVACVCKSYYPFG